MTIDSLQSLSSFVIVDFPHVWMTKRPWDCKIIMFRLLVPSNQPRHLMRAERIQISSSSFSHRLLSSWLRKQFKYISGLNLFKSTAHSFLSKDLQRLTFLPLPHVNRKLVSYFRSCPLFRESRQEQIPSHHLPLLVPEISCVLILPLIL